MALDERSFPRTPNSQTASWFLDIYSSGKLNLTPPYQRRSVWNLDYRQFFIDSIVRNYPTQAIFLEVDIDPDRPTDYKVLDGKQRLTSLISFVNDEFPAPESLSDLDLADKYYSDFPREMKTRILNYKFTVESVTGVTAAELNQAFDRLNRNVARLNKQELRHAQYGGVFISRMERFAESPFWEEIGLVTTSRRRRMLDVEYISEFYVITARGVQDGKDYLDQVYAEFDQEIPHERTVDRLFRRTRDFLENVHEHNPISSTRFRNIADFYSLWAAVTDLFRMQVEMDPVTASSYLADFSSEVEAQKTTRARRYLTTARQGSNKAANRQTRAKILSEVLKGV
jgi:hypothetical protein